MKLYKFASRSCIFFVHFKLFFFSMLPNVAPEIRWCWVSLPAYLQILLRRSCCSSAEAEAAHAFITDWPTRTSHAGRKEAAHLYHGTVHKDIWMVKVRVGELIQPFFLQRNAQGAKLRLHIHSWLSFTSNLHKLNNSLWAATALPLQPPQSGIKSTL